MMLDTDLCMAFKRTRGNNIREDGNYLLASMGNCCTWMENRPLFDGGAFTQGINNAFCGSYVSSPVGQTRNRCCTGAGSQ